MYYNFPIPPYPQRLNIHLIQAETEPRIWISPSLHSKYRGHHNPCTIGLKEANPTNNYLCEATYVNLHLD